MVGPWLETPCSAACCNSAPEQRQDIDKPTGPATLPDLGPCFGGTEGCSFGLRTVAADWWNSMTGGKIRIRMEAYDHIALDASAKEIVEHAKRTNAKVAGPIPLPTRIERYTVLRSPFIDKKSREQFEIRTHKRIIDILEPNARTVEALNRLVVPAGVFVRIKA